MEMQRQVGMARPARDGLMYRGLMIRHLVMPRRVAGTREVVRSIAENLPKNTVSVGTVKKSMAAMTSR